MPADMRLHYLFDPDSLNEGLSSAIEVADPVRLDTLTNQDQRLIAAGEGTISSFPAILAIADPYAVSQYSHFVTLLAAIRTALQRKSPLITIYPSDAIPKRKSDNPGKAELSSAEITYLTIETDSLSQDCLPQITILTDSDPTAGFSTKFPLGDLVLAEQSSACPNRVSERTESLSKVTLQKTPLSSHTQPDVMIDRQVQRQDLPATLGKLLAFFAK
jgi:acetyl-CoA carboxylase beta subunit